MMTADSVSNGRLATRGSVASSVRKDHVQPSAFPRRILVAVTGLSPQVVTETLYALIHEVRPGVSFVPTEIQLITTAEGAERARLTLLSRDPGWFHRLCREYRLAPVRFDDGTIHILTGTDEKPLEDIRSPEDNQRAADGITSAIRRLTADPESALHVSIAGGRKTMGFYAGYALSLYGRAQDRLSHVLVAAPYESNAGFYYPTRESHIIYTPTPDSRPLDTRNAQVTLADIPFVSLRHGLPEPLLRGATSFSAAVAAAAQNLGPPELVIDLSHRSIQAGGKKVSLPPAELAFYSWFARRRLNGEEPIPCPADGVADEDYAAAFLLEYRALLGPMGDDERVAARLAGGIDKGYFLERRAKLQKILRSALGLESARYSIHRFGQRPRSRYGLALEPHQIRFRAVDLPSAQITFRRNRDER